MRTFAMLLVALLAFAPSAIAQSGTPKGSPPPGRPDASAQTREMPIGQLRMTGQVHVGEGLPDFTAASSSGREVSLSRLRGNWLVLVFAQNREDFLAFRGVHESIVGAGARVYGLCKEKAYRLRSTAEEHELPFELLADDTGEISALYGYYDWEHRSTVPGFVVADRQGVVRLALQGQATPEQVAELVRFTIVGF